MQAVVVCDSAANCTTAPSAPKVATSWSTKPASQMSPRTTSTRPGVRSFSASGDAAYVSLSRR